LAPDPKTLRGQIIDAKGPLSKRLGSELATASAAKPMGIAKLL